MIRRGKTEGWLTLSPDDFERWSKVNQVEFQGVCPGNVPGRGGVLIASQALSQVSDEGPAQVLMTIPRDLILSLERIQKHAEVDETFREVLTALGEFASTARGAILSFLLVQASLSMPGLIGSPHVTLPFADYVKSLPLELLPTFWEPAELELLVGTTLAPAVVAKLRSLRREWNLLLSSVGQTTWYQKVSELLDFNDWLCVDAMYRSRALDYPQIGHCMIPCMDLASHESGEATIAVYESDAAGNAVLLLRNGKGAARGDEVTITYGDEKGACEMLFSYGFLESDRETAETLFLSLSIPEDDPLRSWKAQFADVAPGVKLIDAGDGEIDWKGEFVWLLCVNPDDGLRFERKETIDHAGEEEVRVFFGDHELTEGAPQLYQILGSSPLWDLFRLRAVAILQDRIAQQLQVLYGSQDELELRPHGEGTAIRDLPFDQAMQLRRLEGELLERAYEDFENQKVELAGSEAVQRYLASINTDENGEGEGGGSF